MKNNIIQKSLLYILLVLIAFILLFPILYIVLGSFKTNSEVLAHPDWIVPRMPTLDNYKQVWKSDLFDFKSMFFNSVTYTLVCVVSTILISATSAYAFERGEFPLKNVIFAVFASLMFVNMGGGVTIYPLFDILNAIHMNKGLVGLMIIKLFGIPITSIYLIRSYIATLPKEIDEAATIDGCSFTGIFFRITIHLLKPILATIGILTFKNSWNEYLLPAIFTTALPAQRTLTVGIVALKSSGEAASSWNLMLAGSAITILPVVIAYIFGNRFFMSGLTSGAVKG